MSAQQNPGGVDVPRLGGPGFQVVSLRPEAAVVRWQPNSVRAEQH
jgi:hypothetical protein